MPKFLKGTYIVSVDEFDELLEKFNKKEFVTIKGKQYLPLYVKKKSQDINKEELEREIQFHATKKDLCITLGTTYFKLEKFCQTEYNSTDLEEIKKLLAK